MIIPLLIGGLGNRLYQLANAFRLRDKYNTELKLYSLDPLPENLANYAYLGVRRPEDFADFGGHYLNKKDGLPQTLNELFPTLNFETIAYEDLKYDRICKEGEVIDPSLDTLVLGYYFGYSNIKDHIQELKECFNHIKAEVPPNTLGVHLRLGIGTDNYACFNVDMNFYHIVEKETTYDQCYIFTDNVIDATEFLKNTNFKNVKIIENNPMYLDMLMLSKCDTVAISLSTLSAWSAYFSKGKVYVPNNWMTQHSKDIAKNWIII